MAWSFGWQPAREASGKDWIEPFLAQLLDDPYDAVRFIAHRSLRQIVDRDLQYDFLDPQEKRSQTIRNMRDDWQKEYQHQAEHDSVLIDQDGKLRVDVFERLLKQRDNHPIYLLE